jgi:hypothetical protein
MCLSVSRQAARSSLHAAFSVDSRTVPWWNTLCFEANSMRVLRWALVSYLAVGFLSAGCGGATTSSATPDAAASDATPNDGASNDLGAPDTWAPETGQPDIGVPEADSGSDGTTDAPYDGTQGDATSPTDASGSWTCGSVTCLSSEYCTDQFLPSAPDGGHVPDRYQCTPIPVSCVGMGECECIKRAIPASAPCSLATSPETTCDLDSAGHALVACQGTN